MKPFDPDEFERAVREDVARVSKPRRKQSTGNSACVEHASQGVSLDDFHAYMPMHSYIYAPTRDMWPAASVNARIPPVPCRRLRQPVLDDDGKPKRIAQARGSTTTSRSSK